MGNILFQAAFGCVQLAQIIREIGWQFARGAGNNAFIVLSALAYKCDGGKFINHLGRIGRSFGAVLFHQWDVVVLEANGFFGVVNNPARKENGAVENVVG